MPYFRPISFAVCALLWGACSSEQPEPASFSPAFDYLHEKRLLGETFDAAEENVLHVSLASGAPQLRLVPLDGSGPGAVIDLPPGEPESFSFIPGQSRMVVHMRPKDSKGDRLYIGSLGAGLDELNVGTGVRIEFYAWRAGGQGFFFGSNQAVKEFMYLYSMDLKKRSTELVLQTQDLQFAAASDSERYLALVKPLPLMQSEMLYYDREAKKLQRQTPIGGGQLMAPQYFEPGGRSFVYLSDADSGVVRPERFLIDENRSEPLFPDWNLGSILYARLGGGGAYVAVGEANRGGAVRPHLLNPETGQPIQLEGLEGADWEILDISPSGRWMSYKIPQRGEDSLFLYDFETGSNGVLFTRADLSSLNKK